MTIILNCIKKNDFISYIVFAIITTIVNVGVYLLFYNYITNDILLCNIVAYFMSITLAFILNKNVVFGNKKGNIFLQMILFLGVKLISFSIDSVVLVVLHDYLKMNNFLAKIISNASTTLSNYLLNKKVVFK